MGTHSGYKPFRTVTATEDTVLVAATQQTAPVLADDGVVAFEGQVGMLHIRFKGTAAENLTFSYYLWAYKSLTDPAEYVAHGLLNLTGLTQTGETNEFYADTLIITAQAWNKTVSLINTTGGSQVPANAGICKLLLDSCEYPVWKIQIRDIGAGGECAKCGADIANFY